MKEMRKKEKETRGASSGRGLAARAGGEHRFKPSRPQSSGAQAVPGQEAKRGGSPMERELIEPAGATRRVETLAVTVGRWDLRAGRT